MLQVALLYIQEVPVDSTVPFRYAPHYTSEVRVESCSLVIVVSDVSSIM